MNNVIFMILAVFFITTLTLIIISLLITLVRSTNPPHVRAGRRGERIVNGLIEGILSKKDTLLTNVAISSRGMNTELDNVIINNNGVFIIEVKNYSGKLSGQENDTNWTRTKVSYAGSRYTNEINNPVKQVKRQIYLLSKYFNENNINVFIKGYVFFVNHNGSIRSNYILNSRKEIDKAIHSTNKNYIDSQTQKRMKKLLS